MATLRSNGILIVDAIPIHTPVNNQPRLAFNPNTSVFYAYDGAWSSINLEIGNEVDFSGKTSFSLPVSATPVVNSNGEIALDTTVVDVSHGVIKYFGGEEMVVIAVPIAEFTGLADGDVIKYNAVADEFQIGSVPTASGGLKQYKAYWAQSGVVAPTLIASLVNDFGTPFTLARVSAGVYTATLAGAFPDGDKFFPLTITVQSTAKPLMYSLRRTTANELTIEFYGQDGVAVDLEGRVAIGFEQHP